MNDINKHIEKLIKMLQSPKPNTRYEACEYLRVAPTITPEAISALQNALNDPNADVADAAQLALNIQLSPEPAEVQLLPASSRKKVKHKKILLFFHAIISLAFFVIFAYTSVKDVISVSSYYRWGICYSIPAIIILALLKSSYSFLNESYSAPFKYFPVVVNYSTTILAVAVIIISSVFDLAFVAHQNEFSHVVQLIQENKLYSSKFGRVELPSKYSHLSSNNSVIVVKNGESVSIMFFDGIESSDGLAWGFMYSSDPDKPIDGDFAKCAKWRPLRPNHRNWFYCFYFIATFNL